MADLENDDEYTTKDALRFKRYLTIANDKLAERDATICELTSKVKQLEVELEDRQKHLTTITMGLLDWKKEEPDKRVELKLEYLLKEVGIIIIW